MKFLSAFLLFGMVSFAQAALTPMQQHMLDVVTNIESNFKTLYAPAKWKQEFADWQLESEMKKLKKVVETTPITVKEFQKHLREFFNSTKDYHVGFRFLSTEAATLPLVIRGAEKRYFIVHIDREGLSKESFPFEVGDEITTFSGKTTDEVVQTLKVEVGANSPLTDQALAEYRLTSRAASRAMTVPQGPVTLGIKRKGKEKVVQHQLTWKYEPETVHFETKEINIPFKDESEDKIAKLLKKHHMMADLGVLENQMASKFRIGNKESFIPTLGKLVWESDKENPFHAYMFLNEENKLIGYIRIWGYMAGEEEALEFEKIMKKFTELTDGLVIDQVNNPGGSVFYLYSLVSMLTDTTMTTPKHHMSLHTDDLVEAIGMLEDLKKVKTDEEAQKLFGSKTASGFPISMTFVEFVKNFLQFQINEWNAGRRLTTPFYLWGADSINPHPNVNYTKPILLLINELDFSGGDFFPAIMQDNKRVTIHGTRTAGAGGYVLSQKVPNLVGLERYSVTGSLAKRVTDNPIENLGVTPDVEYKLTADDYQNDFEGYKKSILETLKTVLTK